MNVASGERRLPSWLRRPAGSSAETFELKRLLRSSALNTVCEEARCPNITECFSRGTATFMILGDVCTRGCRFCSVSTGKPTFSDFNQEAESVAIAAEKLGLKYVVVTSVARDDLPDGGASAFAKTIAAIRRQIPAAQIEVLIPDLRGNVQAIESVVQAAPDVLNHNLETVPRLYRRVRPGASYSRSLELLSFAKSLSSRLVTKTGLMLGVGESSEEVVAVMRDARAHNVDIFTAGQYLQPSKGHLPVEQYLPLESFDHLKQIASELGFMQVAIGPLVRSSYHAEEIWHSETIGHAGQPPVRVEQLSQ